MHEKTTLAKPQMPNNTAQMENKNYVKNEPNTPTQKWRTATNGAGFNAGHTVATLRDRNKNEPMTAN